MSNYSRAPLGPIVRRIDPITGATTALEDKNGVELGLPFLTSAQAAAVAIYTKRFTGTIAVPVSSFNGASSSGLAGLPSSIAIPANSITAGSSKTTIRYVARKVGTGTAFLTLRYGPLNSLSDTDPLSNASGTQFSATDPLEIEWFVTITYAYGKGHVRFQRNVPTSGFFFDASKTSSWVDFTVDATVVNYINFAWSGAAAGSTYDLIEAEVQHFQ